MMAATHRVNRALFDRVWRSMMAARGLPEPTGQMLQLVQAVAALETSYASPAGWTKNSPAMADSHNYGAIMCQGPGPDCAEAHDRTQAGVPFVAYFKKYPSAEAGVADLITFLTGPRKRSRAPLLDATSASAFAGAMYEDHYFGGVCTKTIAMYGKEVAKQTAFANAAGATTSGGAACDAEVKAAYSATVKRYVDEVAAAMGEEPVPLGGGLLDGPLWPILAVLGVAALGVGGWYVYKEYFAGPPKRTTRAPLLRRNASRAEWRALYAGACGTERSERRGRAAELIKKDRGEIRKGQRASKRLAGRRAEADRPCEDAKEELRKRTEREAREASERRTPKQREASRRTLGRQRELAEVEAREIEAVIGDEFGPELAALAGADFWKHAPKYLAEARRETAKHPRSRTTAAEIYAEDFRENIDEWRQRVEDPEIEEETEEEYRERMAYAS
jgi:hypothetical protein